MTKEEIIRNLKYTMEKHKNDTVSTFDTNISVMCKDILDYLEQESKMEWIPVSEKLPKEENKRYWICTDCGDQCVCRWTNVNPVWTDIITDWHWHIADFPQDSKVVAWMPLPEPYKKGGEE